MAVLDSYTAAVEELGAVGQMWNPFQLIYTGDQAINQWATFIHSMQRIGICILVFMAALRFVKMYLDELSGIPSIAGMLGVGVEMVLTAVFLLNYTWFAEVLPLLFHRLTSSILNNYDGDMMKQVVTALQAVGSEKSSDTKWFSLNIAFASIPNIISTAMAGLAMALYWVMSKWQAVLYTFWYLVGPLLMPFYIFPPFRSVAERWFGSLLGASFMGVVGSIMFLLMVRMEWLTKAFSSGVNSSYTAAMVFSILILLLMISIPKLSNSIWQGIAASAAQAVAAASMFGGMAASTAVASAGGALQGAGTTVRAGTGLAGVLNRYADTAGEGMSTGDRIRDAIRNRDAYRRAGGSKTMGERVLAGTHRMGAGMGDFGHDVLMSQMPSSVRNLERTMATSEKDKQVKRDQGNFREQLAERVGPERAASVILPEGWMVRPGINQTYEAALASNVDRVAKDLERQESQDAVRTAAAGLVGKEAAANLKMPPSFSLKPRSGQTQSDAALAAADSMLRKQGLMDEPTQVRIDHAAVKDFMLTKLGPERAGDILVPSAWRVMPKKGQSRKEAIAGSATALMQQLGLIDQKGSNRIASRYTYSQARKRKDEPPKPKEGDNA